MALVLLDQAPVLVHHRLAAAKADRALALEPAPRLHGRTGTRWVTPLNVALEGRPRPSGISSCSLIGFLRPLAAQISGRFSPQNAHAVAQAIFGLIGVLVGGLITWGLERGESGSALLMTPAWRPGW